MSQLSAILTQWTMASGAALIGLFALGGEASLGELPKAGTSFTDCTGCPEMVVVSGRLSYRPQGRPRKAIK